MEWCRGKRGLSLDLFKKIVLLIKIRRNLNLQMITLSLKKS